MSWDHRPWDTESRQRERMEFERLQFKRREIEEELKRENRICSSCNCQGRNKTFPENN